MTFAGGGAGQEVVIRITAEDATGEAFDKIRARWAGGGGSGGAGGGSRGGPVPPIAVQANTSAFDTAMTRLQSQLTKVSSSAHRVTLALVDQVTARADQINRQIGRIVSAPFRFILQAQDNVSGTLRRLRRVARYLTTIRRLTNIMLDPFKQMTGAAVLNAQLESTVRTLQAMGMSAGAAQEEMTKLRRIGSASGMDSQGIENVAAGLARVRVTGFAAEQSLRAMTTASLALGLGQKGVEQFGSTFETMATQPAVAWGQIQELQKMGLPALEALASAWGISTLAMRGAIEQGIVPTGAAMRILQGEMNKPLYQTLADQARKTTPVLLQSLKTMFDDNVIARFGRGFDKYLGPQLQKLSDFFTSPAGEVFFQKIEAAGSRIGEFLGGLADRVGDIYKTLSDPSQGGSTDLWSRITKSLGDWWNKSGKAEARKLAGEIGTALGDFTSEFIIAVAGVITGLTKEGGIGGKVGEQGTSVGGTFVTAFATAIREHQKEIADALGDALNNAFSAYWNARPKITGGQGGPEPTQDPGGAAQYTGLFAIGSALAGVLAGRFLWTAPVLGGLVQGTAAIATKLAELARSGIRAVLPDAFTRAGWGRAIGNAAETVAEAGPTAARVASEVVPTVERVAAEVVPAVTETTATAVRVASQAAPVIEEVAANPFMKLLGNVARVVELPAAVWSIATSPAVQNLGYLRADPNVPGGLTADAEAAAAMEWRGKQIGGDVDVGDYIKSLPGRLLTMAFGGTGGEYISDSIAAYRQARTFHPEDFPDLAGSGAERGDRGGDLTHGLMRNAAGVEIAGIRDANNKAVEDSTTLWDRMKQETLPAVRFQLEALALQVREATLALSRLRLPGGSGGASGGGAASGITSEQTQAAFESMGFDSAEAAKLAAYACGSLAVAGIMQAAGDPTSVKDVVEESRSDFGLDVKGPAGQFTASVMGQQLAKHGITQNALGSGDTGLAAAVKDLKEGRMVGIDTAGHHLDASAIDEQGRMYVGNSGKALRGGSDWMTPAEIAANAGAGAIQGFYDYSKGGQAVQGTSLNTLRGGGGDVSLGGISMRAGQGSAGLRFTQGINTATAGQSAVPNMDPWDLFTVMARQRGIPESEWAGYKAILQQESSGGANSSAQNPVAVNGQHATGGWQFLPSTFYAYAEPGHADILNPTDQNLAVMNYIAKRYKGSVYNTPYYQTGTGRFDPSAGGYATGGVLNEHVVGVGVATGRPYNLAERGPERISPMSGGGGATAGLTIGSIAITISATGVDLSNSRQLAARLADDVAAEIARRQEQVLDNMPGI